MAQRLKNLLSKLELPTNDWVLSRFGGCEPRDSPATAGNEAAPDEEPAPMSEAPTSVARRLFERWLDHPVTEDRTTEPPQSGERLSPNASADDATSEASPDDRKSRAS